MWLVWWSRALMSVTVWFLSAFFSPKKVQALVALSLLHGPVGMLWAVTPGYQSTWGRGEGMLLHWLEWRHEAIASSLLTFQHRNGWLLFVNCGLFTCLVFLCGRRTGCSAGMLFGVSGSFNLLQILWLIAAAIKFSVWRQHHSHEWWEGTKAIFLFSSSEDLFWSGQFSQFCCWLGFLIFWGVCGFFCY